MSNSSSSSSSVRPATADPYLLDWQSVLADAITDPAELCRELDLPESITEAALGASREFPALVPRTFLARMGPCDADDPLLAQVLPTAAELTPTPGFTADPVGEASATAAPCLLRKYANRSLIVTTGRCGVHCRFCFRRHFAFPESPELPKHLESAVAQIAADPTIHEVILSGGDPLALGDDRLAEIASRLNRIPHLRRLRLHTRLPVLVPQRITEEFLDVLSGSRLTPFVVVHVNHPAEIDRYVEQALGRLVDAGVPVMSQSVLLRGVNDRLEVLAELYERLVDNRVVPYYLHQLDRVAGAAHFEVPEELGVKLIAQLRTRLPGYAIPRYVREVTGEDNKVPLAGG